MTREEAIKYLKRADTTVGQKIKTRTAEALEMAIKALEQESTTKNDLGVDCISRKADMHYPPESESAYEKALLKAYADGQESILKDIKEIMDRNKYPEYLEEDLCNYMESKT